MKLAQLTNIQKESDEMFYIEKHLLYIEKKKKKDVL